MTNGRRGAVRVHLRGVHTVRKRSGKAYHYAWRGGPRIDAEPGTPAFLAAYQKAHADRTKPEPGTLFTLLSEFRTSAEYMLLRDATRRDYARYLKLIEAEFSSVPLGALQDERIRGDFKEWRDSMADRPRTADMAWTVLARVFSVAKDRRRISANPCERGGRLYAPDRRDKIWTDDLIARAMTGLPPPLRWAFVLALWTGQRQGDLLRLSWSAIQDGKLRVKQSKTGRRLLIPIGAPLVAELSAVPKVSPIILTNSFAKPWTGDGFRASWGKAVSRLKIEGLTFHDVRGSAVTRLAEAGCTEAEIVSITGHSHADVGEMLDRHYLSRTNVLAENAIRRLERLDRERNCKLECKPLSRTKGGSSLSH